MSASLALAGHPLISLYGRGSSLSVVILCHSNKKGLDCYTPLGGGHCEIL